MKKKVIIMGAAGRDFHDFNTFFRDNEDYEVVAFTATQIPNIDGRKYPAELAGKLYPKGIPIYSEDDLLKLIEEHDVDEVFFSYSDVSHEYVMHRASKVLSKGATFSILGAKRNMILPEKMLIAVCATRTGSGKSQVTRKIAEILKAHGKKVAVVRHPMPYGNLVEQRVQRFETYEDCEKFKCTIEEREEYEPHLEKGHLVFAGVDYEAILKEAEKEADIILWDGGNNDISFFKPCTLFVVTDPFRVGHEQTFHPGETNLLMADVVIINKVNSAKKEDVEKLRENIKKLNPKAKILEFNSELKLETEEDLNGKKVLCVEDGPTVTHGGMDVGAGWFAAKEAGAIPVEPKEKAVGSIKETFEKYPHLKNVLPAMGYSKQQIKELEETINNVDCDFVIAGTPIDLAKLVKVNKPIIRVRYQVDEEGKKLLEQELKDYF